MKPIPIILVAIALLSVPLIWLALSPFLPERTARVSGPGIDSGARIEIEGLRQQIEGLEERLAIVTEQGARLEDALRQLSSRSGDAGIAPVDLQPADPEDAPFGEDGVNDIADSYAQVVLIPERRSVNKGLKVGGPRFLEEFLGRPRATLSDRCESMDHPKLKSMLKVEKVGPIRVQMLQPALDSLTRIFQKVEAADPDLYARINTAGSLCVRQIRGTRGRTSTHSFGLAVDLNIDGKLDTLGDGKTQLGLIILSDFFIAEGWVWGAAYSREDSMHFEVSRQTLEAWRAEGKI